MPFVPHIKMTALGKFSTSGETFSWGLSLVEEGWTFPNHFEATSYWTEVADSMKDFHSSPTTNINQHVILEGVKFARIQADGTYGDRGVNYTESFIVQYNAAGAGGAAPIYPPQDALCVTLDTDRGGPSGRGRVFLPMPSFGVLHSDQYRIDAGQASDVATRFQTMCNDINNSPGPDASGSVRIVVASNKGYNSAVTSIRVGRVVDTMRSRRKKLEEAYTADFAVS